MNDPPVTLVSQEYSALAPSYEQRWHRYLETTASHTLTALAPQPNERILDGGCGTGFLLRKLSAAAPGAELTGVDITPAMLSCAANQALPGTSLELADVRCLPFAEATFDAVILASVIHYLPNAEAAFTEAARVLRPAGRLIVTDWCGDAPAMRLLGWTLRRPGHAPVRLRRLTEIRQLLSSAGFRIVASEVYGAGFPWRLLTLRSTHPREEATA